MFHLRPDLLGIRHAPLDTAVPRLLYHKLFFFTTKTVRRGDTSLSQKKRLLEVGSAGALLYIVNKLGHWGSSEICYLLIYSLFTYILNNLGHSGACENRLCPGEIWEKNWRLTFSAGAFAELQAEICQQSLLGSFVHSLVQSLLGSCTRSCNLC